MLSPTSLDDPIWEVGAASSRTGTASKNDTASTVPYLNLRTTKTCSEEKETLGLEKQLGQSISMFANQTPFIQD